MEWSALTPSGPDVDASGNIITGAQVEGSTVALYTDYSKRAEINVNGQLLLAPRGIYRKDLSSNDVLPAAKDAHLIVVIMMLFEFHLVLNYE